MVEGIVEDGAEFIDGELFGRHVWASHPITEFINRRSDVFNLEIWFDLSGEYARVFGKDLDIIKRFHEIWSRLPAQVQDNRDWSLRRLFGLQVRVGAVGRCLVITRLF